MGENKIVKKVEQKPSKMSQNFLDKLFKNVTLFFAVIIVALMVWMVIALIIQSKLSIEKFGFSFIKSIEWDPVKDEFGALPFIYGTIVSSIIAVLIATPISIGIGLFLTEISNKWMKTIIGFMVQILASIPSILYGLWGLFILYFIRDYFQKPVSGILGWFPLFSGAPIGLGMLSAGLILAIMIIPIISALVVDIIETVPTDLKAGVPRSWFY